MAIPVHRCDYPGCTEMCHYEFVVEVWYCKAHNACETHYKGPVHLGSHKPNEGGRIGDPVDKPSKPPKTVAKLGDGTFDPGKETVTKDEYYELS